ncbi:MAG: serine hydrolase [Bacteroidota bacterium]
MTDSAPPRGCSRHLLIIAVLFGVALVIVVARSPDGVRNLLANQQAMREGSEEARQIDSPDALLSWIAAHPERASLVVLDADGTERLRLAGEAERPVAGLPALWVAAAWAEQSASGRLDPSAVAPEALAVRRLPGTGGGDADTLALSPEALVRRTLAGDRAAESALVDRLGDQAVAERARRYGVAAPVPFEGMLLAWQDGDTTAAEAPALARRLARDEAFREAAVQRFYDEGFRLTLAEQRAAAGASLPRGSALSYARLLTDALSGTLSSPDASARFLDVLAVPDSLGGDALRFGAKGGGFPGHLAFAAWVQTAEHPAGRSAVLILDDLPLGLFYHLSQTGLDSGLIFRLLTDEAFLDQRRGTGLRRD